MESILKLTLSELQDNLSRGKLSSRELTQAYLDRIDAMDAKIGAYLNVLREGALEQADAADRARKTGKTSPLLGIPLGLKANLCVHNVVCSCASRMLETFRPPYDATVITNLRNAGAVFLGMLNMDEFAMGSTCETSYFRPVHNPWNLECVPGGSSGGSAAAMSAKFAAATLGSDTGGSIRQPAALCGVVGLKPTYGRVSRYGLMAFASSLDQIGPITATVRDAAIMLNALAGHDPMDSTSVPIEVPDYTASLGHEIKGMRIGLPKEYFIEGLHQEIEASVRKAADQMKALGAEILEIELPHAQYAAPTYYIAATAEASSNLAKYTGMHFGYRAKHATNALDTITQSRTEAFGSEVKRRIMLGTYVLSEGFFDAYYVRAMKVRTLIRQDFENAFKKVDAILTPTTPTTAFKLGEKISDPLQVYLNDIFTISANLAGIPGISLPCGFTNSGMPIGMQLMAPVFEESKLLQIAYAYEQSQTWSTCIPNLDII